MYLKKNFDLKSVKIFSLKMAPKIIFTLNSYPITTTLMTFKHHDNSLLGEPVWYLGPKLERVTLVSKLRRLHLLQDACSDEQVLFRNREPEMLSNYTKNEVFYYFFCKCDQMRPNSIFVQLQINQKYFFCVKWSANLNVIPQTKNL